MRRIWKDSYGSECGGLFPKVMFKKDFQVINVDSPFKDGVKIRNVNSHCGLLPVHLYQSYSLFVMVSMINLSAPVPKPVLWSPWFAISVRTSHRSSLEGNVHNGRIIHHSQFSLNTLGPRHNAFCVGLPFCRHFQISFLVNYFFFKITFSSKLFHYNSHLTKVCSQ